MATDPQTPLAVTAHAGKIQLDRAVEDLRQRDHGASGRVTQTLVTLPGLRVVVVSMRAGSVWNEHSTEGRITVQPLVGQIRMRFAEGEFELRAGNLAAFPAGVRHDVVAQEDSTFLLTVARPNPD